MINSTSKRRNRDCAHVAKELKHFRDNRLENTKLKLSKKKKESSSISILSTHPQSHCHHWIQPHLCGYHAKEKTLKIELHYPATHFWVFIYSTKTKNSNLKRKVHPMFTAALFMAQICGNQFPRDYQQMNAYRRCDIHILWSITRHKEKGICHCHFFTTWVEFEISC